MFMKDSNDKASPRNIWHIIFLKDQETAKRNFPKFVFLLYWISFLFQVNRRDLSNVWENTDMNEAI